MNKVKLVVLALVVVLAVIVIFQNRERDTVTLLFVDVTMPRFAWLVGSLLVGFALGALTPWRWFLSFWKKKKGGS
jgi:uncharacterized integral membrane protein